MTKFELFNNFLQGKINNDVISLAFTWFINF